LQAGATGQKLEENAEALDMITWPDAEGIDLKDPDALEELVSDIQSIIDELEGIME